MEIKTALSCGDKAWTFEGEHLRQRTVGEIRVTYTQSPGIGDGFMEGGIASYSGGNSGQVADNYAPMEPELIEEYMCVETGIGSGSIYTLGKSIFLTEEECLAANAERLAEIAADKKRRADYERDQRIQRLRSLRHEITSLKRHVGMSA